MRVSVGVRWAITALIVLATVNANRTHVVNSGGMIAVKRKVGTATLDEQMEISNQKNLRGRPMVSHPEPYGLLTSNVRKDTRGRRKTRTVGAVTVRWCPERLQSPEQYK